MSAGTLALFYYLKKFMPFKSQAQRRYLYKTNPKLAREFEKKTPSSATLPKRVKNVKKSKKKGK